MKYSKLITTTFAVLLMLGLASASAAELTIFPKESTTDIDSFTSYEIQIENIGTLEDSYSFSSTSQPVDIAPRRVELKPGEEETVNVWYNPNTGMDEGRYSFSVTASSRRTGERYSVGGVAKVIKEHNVDVKVSQDGKTSCLDQKAYYQVEVENTGIQPERYRLKSEVGSLSENTVHLEEGETKTVELVASSSQPVKRDFNLVASSMESYAKDVQEMHFTAERCYASELVPQQGQMNLPAKTESTISFELRNTGTKADTFEISSNVGEVQDSEVEIDSGEKETVEVTYTPDSLTKQTINVEAKSQVTSTSSVQTTAYNGMASEVSLGSEDINICEDQQTETAVTVENTGEADEIFNISANKGNLQKSNLELDEGSSASTALSFNGAYYEEGSEHQVNVRSLATSFGEPTSSATTDLTVENCWDLQMNLVPRVSSAGSNKSTVYEIQLENTGTRENTYELDYEGPHWVTLGKREVTVQPGEMKKAFVYTAIPFEKKGTVRITATAEGREVERSEQVKLQIGKDITKEDLQEAIEDQEEEVSPTPNPGSGITGQAISQLGQIEKIVASVLAGLLVTAGILLS